MESVGSKPDMSANRILWMLFGILFLDLLAFTCILPLFPALMDYYAAKQDAQNDDNDGLFGRVSRVSASFQTFIGVPAIPRFNSVYFGGLLGSLFSFLQFVASPLLGALSDVCGRKPLLLFSVIGSLCSYALWAKATTFEVFVVSRVVGGLSKTSISVATALVADVLPPAKRGKGMVAIGLSFSLGFLIGPMIGAYFAVRARAHDPGHFYVLPACFACGLTILEGLFILFLLPETLPKDKRRALTSDVARKVWTYINPVSLFRFSAFENTITKEKLQNVQRLGLVYFLYLLFYSGLEFTLTFLTHIVLNYDSMQQGRMFFFIGLLMMSVQGGYVRRVPDEKLIKVALMGLAVIIPGFILVGVANHVTFYLGLTLYSAASAMVVPSLTTMVSSHGSAKDKGALLGIFRSLGALARAFGPFLTSLIFWTLGPLVCYVLFGALMIIPLWLLRTTTDSKISPLADNGHNSKITLDVNANKIKS